MLNGVSALTEELKRGPRLMTWPLISVVVLSLYLKRIYFVS